MSLQTGGFAVRWTCNTMSKSLKLKVAERSNSKYNNLSRTKITSIAL